jgi:hypothetical protein
MADVVEIVERDGHRIAIYDNGMERDLNRGRLVRPPSNNLITAEKSTEFYRLRVEKKRQRAEAGANAALAALMDDKGEPIWDAPIDEDYIEAISEAQTRLALTGNAYSTRAADFVMDLTGNKEITQASELPLQQASELTGKMAGLVSALTDFLQARGVIQVPLHDTIEGVEMEDVE